MINFIEKMGYSAGQIKNPMGSQMGTQGMPQMNMGMMLQGQMK